MLNLVIWGIRDGFEECLFNLNEVPQTFKSIPRDALFRSLSNRVRPSTYYVITRMNGMNVFTMVHTEITEYNRTAQRPGYVAFSFILNANNFFSESPLSVFDSIMRFYKSRVGEGNANNFTKEEVFQFVNQLKVEIGNSSIQSDKCFSYFSTNQEIEELFIGTKSYALYSEMMLFPSRGDDGIAQLLKEKAADYKLVNLDVERNNENERKGRLKLAEQEGRRIYDLFQGGEKSLAYEAYVSFPYRDLIAGSLKNILDQYAREQSEVRRNQLEREETLRIEKEIITAIQHHDIDRAINLYNSIQHRHHLDPSTKNAIEPHLREKNRIENEIRKKKVAENQIKEKKRKEKKMLLIAFSIGVVLSLGMLSYFLEVPSVLYASNQIENATPGDTVKDNLKPNITESKSPNMLLAKDSLLRGDTLYAGSYPDNSNLDSSFVYFKNNQWYYSKDRSKAFQMVSSNKSIMALNEHFGMTKELMDEVEKASSSSNNVPSNQPKANTTEGKANEQAGQPKKDEGDSKKKGSLQANNKTLPKTQKEEIDDLYNSLFKKETITQDEFNKFSKKIKDKETAGYDMSSYKRKENALKIKLPK